MANLKMKQIKRVKQLLGFETDGDLSTGLLNIVMEDPSLFKDTGFQAKGIKSHPKHHYYMVEEIMVKIQKKEI